jgi:phospholipase A2
MEGIEEELKHRYEKNEWDFHESLEKAIQASKRENYSLTDFWAYLIVSRQIREVSNSQQRMRGSKQLDQSPLSDHPNLGT